MGAAFLKGLKRENLRDHMTNLELIFTMLGEEGTRQSAIKKDAQGFEENRGTAIEGGTAAGMALDAYEASTGDKVVTAQNFNGQITEAKKKASEGLSRWPTFKHSIPMNQWSTAFLTCSPTTISTRRQKGTKSMDVVS